MTALLYYPGVIGEPEQTPDAYWFIGGRAISKLDFIYIGTFSRLSGILLGAAFAMVWRPFAVMRGPLRSKGVVFDAAALVALVGFVWMCWNVYLVTPDGVADARLFRGGMFALSVMTLVLIAAVSHPAARSNRVLGNPVLRWIGLRSYGLYLYHWPIYQAIRKLAGNKLTFVGVRRRGADHGGHHRVVVSLRGNADPYGLVRGDGPARSLESEAVLSARVDLGSGRRRGHVAVRRRGARRQPMSNGTRSPTSSPTTRTRRSTSAQRTPRFLGLRRRVPQRRRRWRRRFRRRRQLRHGGSDHGTSDNAWQPATTTAVDTDTTVVAAPAATTTVAPTPTTTLPVVPATTVPPTTEPPPPPPVIVSRGGDRRCCDHPAHRAATGSGPRRSD